MRILMITLSFPPNKDGVAEAASAAVSGFLQQGWRVDVLTRSAMWSRESSDWRGARVIEYQRPRPGCIAIQEVAHPTIEWIRNGGWDLVFFQAYDDLLMDCLPEIDSIEAGKVLISHGFPGLIRYPTKRFPYGIPTMFRHCLRGLAMLRWIHKLDRVVYLSRPADLKGFYDHWLAKLARYQGRKIIPNGIDPGERGTDPSGFRQCHGIPSDALLFLCVANYSPRKDQAYAARAFRKAAIPNSRLVFIGSKINDHAERFIRQDRALAPPGEEDHVLWLENIDRPSTLDAFEACDAFVLSALHEAQPISLLEAMRAKKPWIARKSGCIHRMEGGLCVKSEKTMTQAMREIASNPDLRNKLGKQGREAVEKNYNRKTYIQRYIDLVKELIPESTNS